MLLHAFQALSERGFPVSNYRYTGMGAVFYTDFILFHRYLHIQKLWSVETCTGISRRLQYNKPFECVELFEREVGCVVPMLSAEEQHILWLDYDKVLDRDVLDDVRKASARLSRGLYF